MPGATLNGVPFVAQVALTFVTTQLSYFLRALLLSTGSSKGELRKQD
jgi:hypothetical protein